MDLMEVMTNLRSVHFIMGVISRAVVCSWILYATQPYARFAIELQGGKFDKADRLFRSIGASWQSASSQNLQDVQELIPGKFFRTLECLFIISPQFSSYTCRVFFSA